MRLENLRGVRDISAYDGGCIGDGVAKFDGDWFSDWSVAGMAGSNVGEALVHLSEFHLSEFTVSESKVTEKHLSE